MFQKLKIPLQIGPSWTPINFALIRTSLTDVILLHLVEDKSSWLALESKNGFETCVVEHLSDLRITTVIEVFVLINHRVQLLMNHKLEPSLKS